MATRAGELLNDADISLDVALNAVTSKSYPMHSADDVSYFQHLATVSQHRKRLVKSPKSYLTDTLLLCHLLDCRLEDLCKRKPDLYGRMIENFVASELLKMLSFSNGRVQLLHFRTSGNKEVDFVLERPDG